MAGWLALLTFHIAKVTLYIHTYTCIMYMYSVIMDKSLFNAYMYMHLDVGWKHLKSVKPGC